MTVITTATATASAVPASSTSQPTLAAGQELARALAAAIAARPHLVDRIAVIRDFVPGKIAFSTSLGLEDQAVLHGVAAAGRDIDVFTLDTGRHFPETLDTLAESEARFGLRIRVVAPEARVVEELVARDGIMGFRLAVENRKACCDVRKVRPLNRALAGADAWIAGLRRGQSAGRSEVPFAAWDSVAKIVRVNPIADWSLEQLEAYVAEHDIPVNALHARGFPSIGCQPCTRAIRPGEDIRAGRWWWENEDGKECGLHNRPRALAGASA
jgi:phosphoadenosine phosphosulfate reductase